MDGPRPLLSESEFSPTHRVLSVMRNDMLDRDVTAGYYIQICHFLHYAARCATLWVAFIDPINAMLCEAM